MWNGTMAECRAQAAPTDAPAPAAVSAYSSPRRAVSGRTAKPALTQKTVDQLLAEARAGLRRLSPGEARQAMLDGAHLVDLRSDAQRAADGLVPGASFVPRNVLEWRLDPSCSYRDPVLADPEAQIVLICDEGYQSSLAAATLQQFGLTKATDVIGGFQAWRASGLPVDQSEGEVRPQ
jgi:rhodanese-related sulfurtransferase